MMVSAAGLAGDTPNRPNNCGNAPLHIAAYKGHLPIVQFLICTVGVNVNIAVAEYPICTVSVDVDTVDTTGKTALQYVAAFLRANGAHE